MAWNIPIPSNILGGILIAAAVLVGGAVKAGIISSAPIRIMLAGAASVGKTSTKERIRVAADNAPPPGKTYTLQAPVNIEYQWDRSNPDTKRRLHIRDMPGEGWIKGLYWKILTSDAPQAIINVIDDRALDRANLGMAHADNQLAAFNLLITNVLSREYKERISEDDRLRVFILAVNKSDLYEKAGKTYDELSEPFLPGIHQLTRAGIETRIIGYRANSRSHVDGLMKVVLQDIDSKRSPWRDWWSYQTLGLRSEYRAFKRWARI